MFSQAILEINNEHEIVRKLKSLVDADSKSEAAKDLGFLLYDVAALTVRHPC
jgi:HSP90 family molecular chaperone